MAQTSVQWLRMMRDHSGLKDCQPHFDKIADELEGAQQALSQINRESLFWQTEASPRSVLARVNATAASAITTSQQ